MKILGMFQKFQQLGNDTVSILINVPASQVDEQLLVACAKMSRKEVEISVASAPEQLVPMSLPDKLNYAQAEVDSALVQLHNVLNEVYRASEATPEHGGLFKEVPDGHEAA